MSTIEAPITEISADSQPVTLFTREEAEAEGFSPEEIFALDRAGLIAKPDWQPWRPLTLEDVEWVGLRIHEYEKEISVREERHQRALKRLGNLRDTFRARFAADCAEVVSANLPRKKDGTPARKSVEGELLDLGVRTVPSRPELTAPEELVRHIYHLPPDAQARHDLAAAVTVKRIEPVTDPEEVLRLAVAHFDGALAMIRNASRTDYQVTVSKKDVTAIAKTLQDVDGETGEAKRADLPGVVWTEPREEWWFK